MRPLISACLLFTSLAAGQSSNPNAVRLTKFILGVDNLDRSYAFYHALGLELDNAKALGKPAPLPDMLLKLVDVPQGTKFRNMMLKIPNTAFELEVTEFSGMDLHSAKPRIQDPGAAMLIFAVDELDAALATAKKAGGVVLTPGGLPIEGTGRAGARAVTLKDPDGYYVQLAQPLSVRPGAGKVVGAAFGTMAVQDAEKTASFYQDKFGFKMNDNGWTTDYDTNLGTPGAQVHDVTVTVPGTNLSWGFFEFKGVDRKPYTPRIPDPGAAAIGLQVHDIEAAIAAMKAAGGSSITAGGSLKLGNGKVGFVRDPNGILVELAQ